MSTAGVSACGACGATVDGSPLCESCDGLARTAFVRVSGEGQGGYEASLFAVLEKLEPQSFWFQARNRLIVWALRTYFPSAQRMLEVGCGTGYVLAGIRRAYPELSLMGSELFPEGLEVARRRVPGVPLLEMDALDVPFRGIFDVVGAFDVLEHIEQDDLVLRELAAAATSHGGLIVTVPQHPRLWSAADEFAGHVRRYTRRQLVEKARRAGWEPVRVTSFVALPVPLFAFSRMLGARDPATYDLERELRLPRPVNAVLDALMQVEQKAIEHGISFPTGGSLLLVARRG